LYKRYSPSVIGAVTTHVELDGMDMWEV
jgi:hypothetical protein